MKSLTSIFASKAYCAMPYAKEKTRDIFQKTRDISQKTTDIFQKTRRIFGKQPRYPIIKGFILFSICATIQ